MNARPLARARLRLKNMPRRSISAAMFNTNITIIIAIIIILAIIIVVVVVIIAIIIIIIIIIIIVVVVVINYYYYYYYYSSSSSSSSRSPQTRLAEVEEHAPQLLRLLKQRLVQQRPQLRPRAAARDAAPSHPVMAILIHYAMHILFICYVLSSDPPC